MRMVCELASDVPEIERYRQSRRYKLKRTFISASDACSKKARDSDIFNNSQEEKSEVPDSIQAVLKDVIFFDVDDEEACNKSGSINKTISLMKKNGAVDLNFDEKTITYQYVYQNKVIGEGKSTSKKKAKALADKNFVDTLQTYCYTLKSKLKFFTMENIITRDDQESSMSTAKVSQIQSNVSWAIIDFNLTISNFSIIQNLGFKMLQSLGWKGGSLGSKNEGIIDPIALSIKIGRLGLGNEAGTKFNLNYFKALLNNYKVINVEYDLVFSSDFTKEERAQLHTLSKNLGLRTKSFGKDNERHIVISSQISPFTIKEKLLRGDPILKEKYDLIPPKIQF